MSYYLLSLVLIHYMDSSKNAEILLLLSKIYSIYNMKEAPQLNYLAVAME